MVTDGYAYLNGTDPEFWIDKDMIECNECGVEFDYQVWRSFTCLECESESK